MYTAPLLPYVQAQSAAALVEVDQNRVIADNFRSKTLLRDSQALPY